jgi:hypothetical protein
VSCENAGLAGPGEYAGGGPLTKGECSEKMMSGEGGLYDMGEVGLFCCEGAAAEFLEDEDDGSSEWSDNLEFSPIALR